MSWSASDCSRTVAAVAGVGAFVASVIGVYQVNAETRVDQAGIISANSEGVNSVREDVIRLDRDLERVRKQTHDFEDRVDKALNALNAESALSDITWLRNEIGALKRQQLNLAQRIHNERSGLSQEELNEVREILGERNEARVSEVSEARENPANGKRVHGDLSITLAGCVRLRYSARCDFRVNYHGFGERALEIESQKTTIIHANSTAAHVMSTMVGRQRLRRGDAPVIKSVKPEMIKVEFTIPDGEVRPLRQVRLGFADGTSLTWALVPIV